MLQLEYYGLDLSQLQKLNGLRYWWLLFAPCIIVPATILVLQHRAGVEQFVANLRWLDTDFGPRRFAPGFRPLLSAIASFRCFSRAGVLGGLSHMLDWRGDHLALMQLRFDMMTSLGNKFFGIVYGTMPAISHCAFYSRFLPAAAGSTG